MKKGYFCYITFYTLFFFVKVMASEKTFTDIENDAKAFAKSIFEENQHKVYDPSVVPSFQTDNPKESEFYTNPSKMESESTAFSKESEFRNIIVNASNERQNYKGIAREIEGGKKFIKEDPTSTIANYYAGCNLKTRYEEKERFEFKTCDEYTERKEHIDAETGDKKLVENHISNCHDLKTKCSLVKRTKLTRTGFESTYKCKKPRHAISKMITCENQIYCIEGDCTEKAIQDDTSKDLTQVVTMINTIKEEERDVQRDNHNIKVFRGEVKSCSKDVVGYNDCCQDNGWGQGMGAKCNAEEKTLGLKREKKQCVHVRTYCSKEGFWGGCVTKKQEYCCFDSNLSKIVAENGRRQLNIPWRKNMGSWIGKVTDCRGFTPLELEKIKFEKIDFSEFTNDLKIKTTNIDPDSIQNQVLDNINSFYED